LLHARCSLIHAAGKRHNLSNWLFGEMTTTNEIVRACDGVIWNMELGSDALATGSGADASGRWVGRKVEPRWNQVGL
jgi:hypothetical protein